MLIPYQLYNIFIYIFFTNNRAICAINSVFCIISLSRQKNRQLAAGLLSCANYLYILVLFNHYMGGAKADGEEGACQPQTCPDSLQLCHGLSLCLHVLRGTYCTAGGNLKQGNWIGRKFI